MSKVTYKIGKPSKHFSPRQLLGFFYKKFENEPSITEAIQILTGATSEELAANFKLLHKDCGNKLKSLYSDLEKTCTFKKGMRLIDIDQDESYLIMPLQLDWALGRLRSMAHNGVPDMYNAELSLICEQIAEIYSQVSLSETMNDLRKFDLFSKGEEVYLNQLEEAIYGE